MRARPAGPGLFPADAVIRRVSREGVLLAGGPRALLLQVAHPAVAAGVLAHSDFRADPLRRLQRTLDAMLTIVFGTDAEARAAAAGVARVHARVVGPGYAATDPDLALWVHATLVDTARCVYRLVVGRLDAREEAAWYEDTKVVAEVLGIPVRVPDDVAAFDAYWDGMLKGGGLRVGPAAREIASAVLRPGLRGVPGFVYRLGDVITAGLLPRSLREAYGLPFGPGRRVAFAVWRDMTRAVVRVTPPALRAVQWSRPAA